MVRGFPSDVHLEISKRPSRSTHTLVASSPSVKTVSPLTCLISWATPLRRSSSDGGKPRNGSMVLKNFLIASDIARLYVIKEMFMNMKWMLFFCAGAL